jgi:hypothetical protein
MKNEGNKKPKRGQNTREKEIQGGASDEEEGKIQREISASVCM